MCVCDFLLLEGHGTSEIPTLTGPDLGRGITLSAVAPNGVLLGHADGEAVLLLRNSDEVFAISARCSHYQIKGSESLTHLEDMDQGVLNRPGFGGDSVN